MMEAHHAAAKSDLRRGPAPAPAKAKPAAAVVRGKPGAGSGGGSAVGGDGGGAGERGKLGNGGARGAGGPAAARHGSRLGSASSAASSGRTGSAARSRRDVGEGAAAEAGEEGPGEAEWGAWGLAVEVKQIGVRIGGQQKMMLVVDDVVPASPGKPPCLAHAAPCPHQLAPALSHPTAPPRLAPHGTAPRRI